MSDLTPEDRRAALVERIAEAIDRTLGLPDDGPCGLGPSAEAVLSLLESGETGVRVVAEGDLQETVGVVLGQLREARAEVEQLRIVETASIRAHALLAEAEAEVRWLRAQRAELLPYASAGADALDVREPYGDIPDEDRDRLSDAAEAMIKRIRRGEFGLLVRTGS